MSDPGPTLAVPPRADGSPSPFRVIVVCTGNICRSPLAAQLLRARLAARTPPGLVEVISAGTHAVIGAAMDPDAAHALAALGVSPDPSHAGRQLVAVDLADADLVLTATREHRSAVARLHPRVVRRAFTLGELARIAPHVSPPAPGTNPHEALAEVIRRAGALRGLGADALPAPEPSDDIDDPYRAGPDTHARVAARIAEAVDAIADLFAAAVVATA